MAVSFRSASNNWCHDFPKVARESGFNFNTHRSRVRVDWNRISCIDIDRVIAERDFSTVEQNVDNIVDCCLESEYDVKILEPNFVKLFRLAQLGVEYLLYCKRYLDRSVAILKDELRSKLEENVKLKNEIDALKSTEKRNRDTARRANDSNGEIHKCPRCPKTFVSATFVNAHMNRRHAYSDPRMVLEDSPVHKRYLDEAEKLHNEIKTLKERLNRTERVIRNDSDGSNIVADEERETPSKDDESYKRYQREISQLKGMLLCEIRNLKRADATREVKEETNDSSGDNVKELIRRQEKEIERLRDELQKRLTPDIEGIHAKLENQEDFWQSKIDNLEARHRNDIEKLYSQLKVSHESVNEMRLDYTSKINDLEWRSRSEMVAIPPQRKIQTRESGGGGGGESKEISRKDNYYPVREMRQRREREEIRNEAIRNDEDIPEVADDTARKDTMASISTDKYRQDDWKNAAISFAESTMIDRRGSDRRMNYNKSNNERIEKQQRDTSSIDSGETTVATTSGSAATRENSTRVLDTNGDAVPFEVHKDDERFLGKTRRENVFVEQSDDKSVEVSSIFSSEESLSNLEDEEESQTEETDEFRKKVKSNNRNNRVEEEFSIEDQLNSKLRDLGIDPEWHAIPNGTFEQIINTIHHDRNFKCKKYHNFDEIRYKIIQQIARKLLAEENVARIEYSSKRSPLEKLVTNVKSKASKAMKILEKNEGSRRSVDSARVERIKTLQKTGQRVSEKTRIRENADTHSPRAVTRKSADCTDRNTIVSTASDLKHSYESIKDFVNDRKIVTSTPQRNERKLTIDSVLSVTNVTSNSNSNGNDNGISNGNKSVLKSTSASNGSRTVKKKVLFDLESKTNPEREDNESEATNLSIYDSRDAVDIEKIEKSPSSGSIVLKTRQSEKIAQISKEIEKQLSIPREKPAGAVEAMFMDKFYSKNDDEESIMANGRSSEGPSRDSQHRFTSESRDSNLDMDIDELLEIQ